MKPGDFIFENQGWRSRVGNAIAWLEPVYQSDNIEIGHR